MKVPPIAVVLLLLLARALFAGEPTNPLWLRGWLDATVAVGRILPAQDETGMVVGHAFGVVGSGVIFADGTSERPWLVTCRHVFFEPGKNWDPPSVQVRFSWFEDRSVLDYLGVSIPLKDKSGKKLWFDLPDKSVDLAAIPIEISKQDAGRDHPIAVHYSDFADADEIYPSAPVLVLGYPGAAGPLYWNKPLLSSGVISWIDSKSPKDAPLVIDAMVSPGNSGGPVFESPSGIGIGGGFIAGRKIGFLGLACAALTASMPLLVDNKPVTVTTPKGTLGATTQEFVGLGVVQPAARVRALLDSIPKAALPENKP
jgi:S1-C subfamily serine protease